MKLGKTIVGEREKTISESERFENRKKNEHRKKLRVAIFIAIVGLILLTAGAVIYNLIKVRENAENLNVISNDTYKPTVEIVDEGGTNYITEKMKSYVGKIERDFKDLGYTVTKAIVPSGKTREIDIYLDGRSEYYKCNLDRGTAETAEDAEIMIRYLITHNVTATYVDVRVAEKAFYK